MTFTAEHLLRRIADTGAVTLSISGVKFVLDMHSSYQVIRLGVVASTNPQADAIQRIYIDNTPLRHVAMHMTDCVERMVHNADVTWPAVLETLYDLLRRHPEWTDAGVTSEGE